MFRMFKTTNKILKFTIMNACICIKLKEISYEA